MSEQITGLIHLSAVVAAISVVAAKMDHAHDDRLDEFEAGIEAARPIAEQIVLKLGLDKPRAQLPVGKWRPTTLFPARVICIIAKRNLDMNPVEKLLHLLYRQIHIPFFQYLSGRAHRRVVFGIANISTVVFFVLVGTLLWNVPLADNYLAQRGCYVVLVVMLLWMFLASFISPYVGGNRLIRKCKKLEAAIDRRFAKRLAKAKRTVEAFE